MINELLEM